MEVAQKLLQKVQTLLLGHIYSFWTVQYINIYDFFKFTFHIKKGSLVIKIPRETNGWVESSWWMYFWYSVIDHENEIKIKSTSRVLQVDKRFERKIERR